MEGRRRKEKARYRQTWSRGGAPRCEEEELGGGSLVA
jgi:hypothetical protein